MHQLSIRYDNFFFLSFLSSSFFSSRKKKLSAYFFLPLTITLSDALLRLVFFCYSKKKMIVFLLVRVRKNANICPTLLTNASILKNYLVPDYSFFFSAFIFLIKRDVGEEEKKQTRRKKKKPNISEVEHIKRAYIGGHNHVFLSTNCFQMVVVFLFI